MQTPKDILEAAEVTHPQLALPLQAVAWATHAATTIKDANGEVLAECSGNGLSSDFAVATAAHIVKACNGYAQMLRPPLPGQHWPEQHGRYAGIMCSEDGLSAWHLIVPDGDEYSFASSKWGPSKSLPGCSSRFDGHANTLAMAKGGSALAKAIRALPGDCYLPARAETALMYATMPVHCPSGWHWTSTQYSGSGYAWGQDFYDGDQYGGGKTYEARARAVRRLPLQSFDTSVEVAA